MIEPRCQKPDAELSDNKRETVGLLKRVQLSSNNKEASTFANSFFFFFDCARARMHQLNV